MRSGRERGCGCGRPFRCRRPAVARLLPRRASAAGQQALVGPVVAVAESAADQEDRRREAVAAEDRIGDRQVVDVAVVDGEDRGPLPRHPAFLQQRGQLAEGDDAVAQQRQQPHLASQRALLEDVAIPFAAAAERVVHQDRDAARGFPPAGTAHGGVHAAPEGVAGDEAEPDLAPVSRGSASPARRGAPAGAAVQERAPQHRLAVRGVEVPAEQLRAGARMEVAELAAEPAVALGVAQDPVRDFSSSWTAVAGVGRLACSHLPEAEAELDVLDRGQVGGEPADLAQGSSAGRRSSPRSSRSSPRAVGQLLVAPVPAVGVGVGEPVPGARRPWVSLPSPAFWGWRGGPPRGRRRARVRR